MESGRGINVAFEFAALAKGMVANHANARAVKNNVTYIDVDEIDILWSEINPDAYRAILRPNPPRKSLYEVTYNTKTRVCTVEEYKHTDSDHVKF